MAISGFEDRLENVIGIDTSGPLSNLTGEALWFGVRAVSKFQYLPVF
jgi:hypothetical protein